MASILCVNGSHTSRWRAYYLRLFIKQRLGVLIVGCFVILFLIYNPGMVDPMRDLTDQMRGASNHASKHYLPLSGSNSSSSSDRDRRCAAFPVIDDILVVVKSGATELFDKVPIQLLTFLECAEQNVILFSDLEQEVGLHHVYDALDEIDEDFKKDNTDFDLYRIQQEYQKAGVEVGRTLKPDMQHAAWTLDKYKNVHMAKKAYDLRPKTSWYVFIDADTYIFWQTLLRWLERLDPTKPAYMGSPAYSYGTAFAHGGSGYILSAAAMEKLVGNEPGIGKRFDEVARRECCGDLVLALSLLDKKIPKLHEVWPMVNGETQRTLPFGPRSWCQPISTLHHVTVAEIDDLHRWEQTRPEQSVPILHKELFHAFFEPYLLPLREDWDNRSEDAHYSDPDAAPKEFKKQKRWSELESNAHKSFDDCKAACVDNKWCFQWMYRPEPKKCSFSKSMRLGAKQSADVAQGNDKASSGWLVDRIQAWITENGNCSEPLWVKGY